MTVRIAAGLLAVLLAACSSTRQPAAVEPPPSAVELAIRGKRLLALGEIDSARAVLERAVALDSGNVQIRQDLAGALYRGAGAGDAARAAEAYAAYRWLEERSEPDGEVYDRLYELGRAMGDTGAVLETARRAAERYPYDRQLFNLGLAQLDARRYGEVISSQKEALERFPGSPYRPGYYRLLGEAYVRVDRYQTAQRVLAEGVRETERMLEDPGMDGDRARARMEEDRIAMLLSLRRLYTIYDEADRLKEVERRLREAGRLE